MSVGVDNHAGTNRQQLKRKLRKIHYEAFCDSVHKQKLDKLNDESDIDAMWLSLSEKFQRVLDSHAPAVAQRRCDKKPHRICPWSTPQLNRLNHQKLMAHRQLLKTPGDPDLRRRFCTLRKEWSKLSRRLKNRYFHERSKSRGEIWSGRVVWAVKIGDFCLAWRCSP